MQYAVDIDFKKYVNLAFPYRIKIEHIWFTADDSLSGDNVGDNYSLERVLRLGAVKHRNAATAGQAASDKNLCWASGFNWYGPSTSLTTEDKPSIWFGNPDMRDGVEDSDPETPEQEVQYDDWWDTEIVFRSTVRPLPTPEKMSYWYNYAWDEPMFNNQKYKTDLSVMNPDEVLSLFVYQDGGNWADYASESGIATIFVAYTGVGGSPASAPTRIWD
jgi:hypothetical protein